MTSRNPGMLMAGLLAGGLALGAAGGSAWRPAEPDHVWSFPGDHRSHPDYRNEWWYFTGHLACVDDPQRRYAYQLTFFRIGLLREPPSLSSGWSTGSLIMGHAALGDLARGRHRFSEVLYRAIPLLGGFGDSPESRLAWSLPPAGSAGLWTIDWNGQGFDLAMSDDERGFALALATSPLKPLVLQGPNGFSRKGREAGAASLYYSFTRLATEGTLRVDGRSCQVRGESWMDKEFGSSQLGAAQVGWDWFSLQLRDAREVMLYLMRRRDGSVDLKSGAIIDKDGRRRELGEADWSVKATATWTSPATGAVYPAGWLVTIPSAGLDLTIAPSFADQENVGHLAGTPYYWEGAVTVRDARGGEAGRGFVELTGYGEKNRPPL